MPKDYPSLIDHKVICFYENYVEKSQPTCFKANQLELITLVEKPISYKVDVSTDTTAISAFDNSAVIAVSLAILATGFSVWLAKKSFQLTKNSFDMVSRQIKTSLESSKVQTQQILTSNTELVSSQLKGVVIGNVMGSRQQWINQVRDCAIDFIYLVDLYCNLRLETRRYYELNPTLDSADSNSKIEEKAEGFLKQLDELFHKIIKMKFMITMYLNPEGEQDKIVIKYVNVIKNNITNLNQQVIDSGPFPNEAIKVIHCERDKFEKEIQVLLKEEWEKVKKGD